MTDILTALKECAENPNAHLTQQECLYAHRTIVGLTDEVRMYEKEREHYLWHNLSGEAENKDSPTVNSIKWTGRWITLVLASIGLFLLIKTWQFSDLYYVCALTLATFYSHALWMSFEWWKK